jgi:glycogen(starch) synthase
VLHVTSEYPPVHFGGLGTAVEGLTRAMAEAGADVVVLLVHGAGYGYGYYGSYGQLYGYGYGSPVRRPGGGDPLQAATGPAPLVLRHDSHADALADARVRLAARRAKVIHLHSSWLWPLASALRDATGLPIVYTAHSIDRAEVEHGEWLPHGSIQDLAIMASDRVVAVSDSERSRLIRYYPTVARRVDVVGNGIGVQPHTHARRHARRSATVLYVGRFGTRKGITDLIEAVPSIAREVPAARFTIVGGATPADGPAEAAAWVPRRLSKYQARMRFHGWLHPGSGTISWYQEADVLVVPSRYEPFGMVVLEGMIAGQAIVAADVDGPAEILEHGRTGLLYPAGCVEELARAVTRLLKDVELRTQLGTAARAEARRRWCWGEAVYRMGRVYGRATAARAPI